MSDSVRVLLVEDDPAVLLGTQQTLQLAGFEVESFADAEAAIPSIFPDVPAIVCDVKLPGLDGLGLLAQAQAIDRDLAVILITSHGDVTMAVNAGRLGAYDFVEKPFPPPIVRNLHQHSPRSSKPFVAINCSSVPEQLFESEMFGFEPGSFTDASHRRIGKFQHANGGTLYLDEIVSIPPALQVKLLRVLQEQKVERLGSNELFAVDVSVIAASKGALKALAEEGQFRKDLLYRLNVAVLDIPPLRDRMEDIPLLFEHFVVDAAGRHKRPLPVITVPQLKELISHYWPGNVRELRNVADRFVLGLLMTQSVSCPHAPFQGFRWVIRSMVRTRSGRRCARRAPRRRAAGVCCSLKLPKRTLYDKMRKWGLSTEEFHASEE